MRKISSRQVGFLKVSKRETDEDAIIRKMRSALKKDPVVIKAFKEYGVSLSELDHASIEFADLDVSAKTKNKKIYINRRLLDKVDKIDVASYLIHEIRHLLQQLTGKTKGNQARDYLEKETEIDAFEDQIEFKKNHKGEPAAEKYTEELVDYHGYQGKEKKDKMKELMGDGK